MERIIKYFDSIESKFKIYVYHLIDSRTNLVFYVGKGHGNRMYVHEKRVRYGNKYGNMELYNKIFEIINNVFIKLNQILICTQPLNCDKY